MTIYRSNCFGHLKSLKYKRFILSVLTISIISPCSASKIIQYGIKNWPIWECEPSTFPWKYDEKEVCLILEGEASIRSDSNQIVEIKSGDLVTFPEGLSCTWEIHKKIRKHYRFGD